MSVLTDEERAKYIEALSAIAVLSEKIAKELILKELSEKEKKTDETN